MVNVGQPQRMLTTVLGKTYDIYVYCSVSDNNNILSWRLKVENDYDNDDKLRFKVGGNNDGESSWPTHCIVPLYLLMNSAADNGFLDHC